MEPKKFKNANKEYGQFINQSTIITWLDNQIKVSHRHMVEPTMVSSLLLDNFKSLEALIGKSIALPFGGLNKLFAHQHFLVKGILEHAKANHPQAKLNLESISDIDNSDVKRMLYIYREQISLFGGYDCTSLDIETKGMSLIIIKTKQIKGKGRVYLGKKNKSDAVVGGTKPGEQVEHQSLDSWMESLPDMAQLLINNNPDDFAFIPDYVFNLIFK